MKKMVPHDLMRVQITKISVPVAVPVVVPAGAGAGVEPTTTAAATAMRCACAPGCRLALGVPKSDEPGGYARCMQYDVNFTELLLKGVREADPSWPTVACRNGWQFNHSEVPYDSIAAEVCLQ